MNALTTLIPWVLRDRKLKCAVHNATGLTQHKISHKIDIIQVSETYFIENVFMKFYNYKI